MSLGMREKPTFPALETKALPKASTVTPSGASITSGPLGETIDAPWPRRSNASAATPSASRSATRGDQLSRVAGYWWAKTASGNPCPAARIVERALEHQSVPGGDGHLQRGEAHARPS